MRIRRRTARWLTLCLTTVVLFMQQAVAGYLCPLLAHEPVAPARVEMQSMPGCDGNMPSVAMPDVDEPSMCRAHCLQDDQANVKPAFEAPTATPILLATLDWQGPSSQPVPISRQLRQGLPGAAPPGSPPLHLLLLVLRN